MTAPTIPSLTLANDSSAMGTNTGDTYGVHFELDAKTAWTYSFGRFPDYEPQIVVTIVIGDGASALCKTEAIGAKIDFAVPAGVDVAKPTLKSNELSWVLTPPQGASPQTVIAPGSPFVFEMTNIVPNNTTGETTITVLPQMGPAPGSSVQTITGTQLDYRVEKTEPPLVISDVDWSLQTKPGSGTLTWQVIGDAVGATVTANGEPIGEPNGYIGNNGSYAAPLILESSTQFVDITAKDVNSNSVSFRASFNFPAFTPFYRLQLSAGTPVSVVLSDESSPMYGLFRGDDGATTIWEQNYSGTQDNWTARETTVAPDQATSTCVHYDGSFFLVGGSSYDFAGFSNKMRVFKDSAWQDIAAPESWTEPRIGQAVALFDGQIWVAGGFGASGTTYDDVYSYLQSDGSGTWTKQATLPEPLSFVSMAVYNGELYSFGGYSGMPGGPAGRETMRLTGGTWVTQTVQPPLGVPDLWALGAAGDELTLFARFDGTAFTGTFDPQQPHWTGGASTLSDVVLKTPAQAPFGFHAVTHKDRIFLVQSDPGASAFFHYDPPALSSARGETVVGAAAPECDEEE